MQYVSTRGRGGAPIGPDEALLAGLAPDGGLFVPTALPRFDLDALKRSSSLAETASIVLTPFFVGSRIAPELRSICDEAFNFDAPLVATSDPNLYSLQLFHGPTAAFKDFAARFLARAIGRLGIGDFTVLVATSGDTGAAVAAAFHRQPGARVVILYPDGRVAARQAHQLGCFGDNVAAYRINGAFDDCQRLAKQALSDQELRKAMQLITANSISLGRLLPQMAYYAHAATHWLKTHDAPLSFAIPTGNLGNAVACLFARACGAPIGDVALAVNSNTTLVDYLATGDYQPHPTIPTYANAMDVGNPSNVERLTWLFPKESERRKAVSATSADDVAIGAAVAQGQYRYGHIWCPHTACAVVAVERLRAGGDTKPWAAVATAHPAKFDNVMAELSMPPIEPPPALAAMLARPAHAEPLANDYAALKALLL